MTPLAVSTRHKRRRVSTTKHSVQSLKKIDAKIVSSSVVHLRSQKSSVAPLKATTKKKKAILHHPLSQQIVPNAEEEHGTGNVSDPHFIPMRTQPNMSNCSHCLHRDQCCCEWFADILDQTYNSLRKKRIVDISGKREMCAKSVLPPFVSRMCDIMKLDASDTFWDLGSGNGSVLFQVAFMTGARCVGVELCPHNAQIARDAWEILRPILEKEAKCTMPEVEIISGDLCEVIADSSFTSTKQMIWTANLLMPKQVTHYMSERFRYLPVGSKVMCFDDLYPHSRSIARIRDPDAFEKFEMKDYKWQPGAVEWCNEPGNFYVHTRK